MAKDWIDFKAVKETADFRVVLERYGLKLKAKGPQLTGFCPFHRDTRPSLRVNLEKGAFHCFGCSAKGNVIDFVSRKEGCTIRRAAELVASWMGQEGGESAKGPFQPIGRRDSTPPVGMRSRGSQRPSRAVE